MFTTLVCCVFPIIGSFRAYESLQAAQADFDRTNFNVAGINVPLGALLKSPEAKNVPSEAQVLVHRHNQVQKWLVYWIVLATMYVGSSVLLLSYWVPFYGAVKVLAGLWLLSPLLVPAAESETDLTGFYSLGCGYVYAVWLRPWMKGELALLSAYSLDTGIYAAAVRLFNVALGYARVLPLGGFLKQPVGPAPAARDVSEEYDVIDAPTDTETTGAKRGWLW